MWLQNGTEIGLAGTMDGHVLVLGLSGQGWHNERVIAAEVGPDAAEPGSILDAAVSPDGMTFATAVAAASEKRLDIVLRDLIASGPGHPITSFDGTYDLVSLRWLSNTTLAIVLRPHPEPPPPPQPEEQGAEEIPQPLRPSEGLQLLVVTGASSVAPLSLKCKMSLLQWSPQGVYAIGMGDQTAQPIVIDRRKSTCTPLRATPPVTVLSWHPDDEGVFLYVQPVEGSKGVFEYDLRSGKSRLVAASSGAASYVGNGPILAFGNQSLTWNVLSRNPLTPVTAELAIFDPDKPEIDIKHLGFRTVPPMIAESAMSYTHATDRALIQTYEPGVPIPTRKLIVYAVHSDSAFQIASGPARGVVETSWSPRGHWLAVLDGDANGSMLTIISPPG
jgi:hypothetical protein